jgi:hypothetical protein
MSAAPDVPDLSALPPELRTAFEAQTVALAAERAARLHLEAEMTDQKAYAARLEALLREMRRARVGPRSEKLHPDQLALALEGETLFAIGSRTMVERDCHRRGEDRSRQAPRGRHGGDGGRAQAAEAASGAAGRPAAHRAGDRAREPALPVRLRRDGQDRRG